MASGAGLDVVPRLVIPLLRMNYLFIVPLVISTIPGPALLQQPVAVAAIVMAAGVGGMLLRSRAMVSVASVSLVLLMVWAKAAADLFGLAAPDTALFLIEFMGVVFLMEASLVTLVFDIRNRELGSKRDDLSRAMRLRTVQWAGVQLVGLGKLTVASIGLSLALLVLGSVASVSVSNIGFTAALVLATVVAVLFLLTHRREPETGLKNRK